MNRTFGRDAAQLLFVALTITDMVASIVKLNLSRLCIGAFLKVSSSECPP